MKENNTIRNIQFYNELESSLPIKKKKLSKFISCFFKNKKIYHNFIHFVFVSPKRIKSINRKFLNHNYPTDVIAFSLNDKKTNLEAEVYLCKTVIHENAKQYNSTLKNELHRVIFHACLHLVGYNDKTEKQMSEMRKMENMLIQKYEKEK